MASDKGVKLSCCPYFLQTSNHGVYFNFRWTVSIIIYSTSVIELIIMAVTCLWLVSFLTACHHRQNVTSFHRDPDETDLCLIVTLSIFWGTNCKD